MTQSWQESLDSFREKLDFFVFFHLGSDAEVNVTEGDFALEVTIAHRRVHDHRFTLDYAQLRGMAGSDDAFEAFMLEQLRRHRRHA